MTSAEKMQELKADGLRAAEPMRLPAQGRAAEALLKKRKRQAHRRNEAFYSERNR